MSYSSIVSLILCVSVIITSCVDLKLLKKGKIEKEKSGNIPPATQKAILRYLFLDLIIFLMIMILLASKIFHR